MTGCFICPIHDRVVKNKSDFELGYLLVESAISAGIVNDLWFVFSSSKQKDKFSEEAQKRFPNIFEACMEEGYDMTKDNVPVTPAQHYMMGGVKTDTNGVTSMKNLYAVGETACNGVHGKNRLASNSLLESLVFAKRAADTIANDKSVKSQETPDVDLEKYTSKDEIQKEFKHIIMDEIERKDPEFYAKWCNDED